MAKITTICCVCRKEMFVKKDPWFIVNKISHGLCPSCSGKKYPKYQDINLFGNFDGNQPQINGGRDGKKKNRLS